MSTQRTVTALTALACALATSGCAAIRNDPVNCKLATGLLGGVIGGTATAVGTHEVDPGSGDRGIAIGAAIGWVAGGLIGLGVGYAVCPKEAPAEPPPPAEPAAAAPATGAGRGEWKPVASNDGEQGHAQNRRGEIHPGS